MAKDKGKKEKVSTTKSYKKKITSFESILPDVKIKQYKDSYTPTEFVGDYTPTEFADEYTPGSYESQYLPQIEAAINRINNWSYDPLQDASYQALAKVYGARGNLAAKNSLADAAALNGGYGSSYAVSAAQQARNQYNQELASMIPQLEQASYERQQNSLNALMDLDNMLYSRFSDDENRRLQGKQFGLDVAGFNEGNKQFGANYGLDVFHENEGNRQFAKTYGLDVFNANQDAYYRGKEFQRSNTTTAADLVSGLLGYKAATEKPKTGTGGGGRGSGGGGGGGYSYSGGGGGGGNDDTPPSRIGIIMSPGNNQGGKLHSANNLVTVKEKDKRSGVRLVK